MHDIDSTRLETSPDQNEFLESQEEFNGEGEDSFEMPMTAEEEEELAAELLGVSSEEEMDQFLGGLFRKIKRGLGGAAKFVAQHAGPLSGALKGIAAKAIPFLGVALGTAIPIPGVGTALGSALGGAASKLLQSELENLELEEQEFEMAKRFVRFASQAVRNAARPPAHRNPNVHVSLAMRNALRRLRGRGGFRPRPIYRYYSRYPAYSTYPCPPCPPCPQVSATGDASSQDDGAMGSDADQSGGAGPEGAAATDAGAASSGELEFEGEGEFERESDSYETDNEFLANPDAGSGRSGRWIRRGRKIVLYGL
jgi:hypothetical protein